MTIQELIQKINESVLSEEAKKKIVDLAGTYTEVSPELEDQVKELIQEDIDKDLAELGADENSPEIAAAEAELESELSDINSEMNNDLDYVNKGIADLDALRAQVEAAEEAHKIAQLRQDLTAGS
jgi:hypothetical protein